MLIRKIYKIKTNSLVDSANLYRILHSLKCKQYNGTSLKFTQLGHNLIHDVYTEGVCIIGYYEDKWLYYGYIDIYPSPRDQVFDLTVNEFVASFSPRRQLL